MLQIRAKDELPKGKIPTPEEQTEILRSIRVFLESALREVTLIRLKFGRGLVSTAITDNYYKELPDNSLYDLIQVPSPSREIFVYDAQGKFIGTLICTKNGPVVLNSNGVSIDLSKMPVFNNKGKRIDLNSVCKNFPNLSDKYFNHDVYISGKYSFPYIINSDGTISYIYDDSIIFPSDIVDITKTEKIVDYPLSRLNSPKFLFYLLFGVDYTEKTLSKVLTRLNIFRNVIFEEKAAERDYKLFDYNKFTKGATSSNEYAIFDSAINDREYNIIVKQYLKLYEYYGENLLDCSNEQLEISLVNEIKTLSQIDHESLNLINHHLFDLFDSRDYIVNNFELTNSFLKIIATIYEASVRFFEVCGIDPNSWLIPTDQYIYNVFKTGRIEKANIIYNEQILENSIHFFSLDNRTEFIKYPTNTHESKIDPNTKLLSARNNIYYKKYNVPISRIFSSKFGGFVVVTEDEKIYIDGKPTDMSLFKDISEDVGLLEYIDSNYIKAYIFGHTVIENNEYFKEYNSLIIEYLYDIPDDHKAWLAEIDAKEIKENIYFIQRSEFYDKIHISEKGTSIVYEKFRVTAPNLKSVIFSGLTKNGKFGMITPTPGEEIYAVDVADPTFNTWYNENECTTLTLTEDNLLIAVKRDTHSEITYLGDIKLEEEDNDPESFRTLMPNMFISKIFPLGGNGFLYELVDNLDEPTHYEYIYEDRIATESITDPDDPDADPEIVYTNFRNYKILDSKPFRSHVLKVLRSEDTMAILLNTGELYYIGKSFLQPETEYRDEFTLKPNIVTQNYVDGKHDIHFLGDDTITGSISSSGYLFTLNSLTSGVEGQFVNPLDNSNTFFIQFWNIFKYNPIYELNEDINTNRQFTKYLSKLFDTVISKYILKKITDTSLRANEMLKEQKIDTKDGRRNRSLNNVYKYNEFLAILNLNYESEDVTNSTLVSLIKFFIYIALHSENLTAIRDKGEVKYNFFNINYQLPFEEEDYIDKIRKGIRRED